ncbi:MAG: hypothetical protein KJP18_07340, partial [Gemmatimonadetes bacterium]|nr:hypothetical protein [Gemmatimonadota bacterium]
MKTPESGRGLLWIVATLLIATAGSLVAVGVGVVTARDDAQARAGLDYRGFLDSVDELLVRSAEDGIVRFEALETRLSDGRRVRWDSLIVEADPAVVPSLQPGGFLFDQVATYNRFQRERLLLARERPVWFDRLAAYNPSVFRSARDGAGERRLTLAPAAWSLRVRSPYEGRWGGEIRARDVRRGAGLLGVESTVSLREPTRLFRTVNGRRQRCEFEPGATEVRAFCLSEQRVPQAIFRLAADEPTPLTAVAGWTDIWVDGQRVSSGDSVPIREGSIVQLDPLEPMLLTEYWEGILSSEQWVNGRSRRVGDFPPPLDLFASLDDPGRGGGIDSDAPIDLSVDAQASVALTRALADFIDERVRLPVEAAQVIVARVP